jgi:putative flavoprotein involved in K+ transport
VEYEVTSERGVWRSRNVVLATGACDQPIVPAWAGSLPAAIVSITPSRYRNPSSLPEGGVLVVGASATGVQLAEELQRSGRPVTLAVGRHTRLPRRYRGRDIMEWFDDAGIWDERYDEVPDIEASRRQPSLQLIGSDDHRSIDLGTLRAEGVRLVGRALGTRAGTISLAQDLEQHVAHAEGRLGALLDRIDAYARRAGLEGRIPAREPIAAVETPSAPASLDLKAEGIRSVLWATGFRPRYDWLRVPVLDARGAILHDGGVTPSPGLFVLGLPFLRRRKSSFLDGAGPDAHDMARLVRRRLERRGCLAA